MFFLTKNQKEYYAHHISAYYTKILNKLLIVAARIDLALTPYELRPNMTKEELKRLNKI